MTREELQQMLDSFQKKVTKKDWEIERDIRFKSQSKDAAKARGKMIDKKHQSNAGKARAEKGGIEQIKSVQSFENSSKGGKVTGRKNIENGHWKKVQEAALKVVTQKVKCPHCPKVGNMNIMKRWHFDNCKKK